MDSHPHAKVGMIMWNDGGDNYVYDVFGDDYYAHDGHDGHAGHAGHDGHDGHPHGQVRKTLFVLRNNRLSMQSDQKRELMSTRNWVQRFFDKDIKIEYFIEKNHLPVEATQGTAWTGKPPGFGNKSTFLTFYTSN